MPATKPTVGWRDWPDNEFPIPSHMTDEELHRYRELTHAFGGKPPVTHMPVGCVCSQTHWALKAEKISHYFDDRESFTLERGTDEGAVDGLFIVAMLFKSYELTIRAPGGRIRLAKDKETGRTTWLM